MITLGKKRELAGRLLAIVVLLSSLGCPCNHASQPDGKTRVRFCFWGNIRDLALWREMSAAFEKENPDIRLKLEFVTGDYLSKLRLMVMGGSAPELILMDDEIHPSYAVRGYLEDLGPYIEKDRAELRIDDILPTAMESFNYGGFQGGLPWDGTATLVFYSKDLFDQAGIPYPAPDWTWDDFRGIARTLTKDTDGDGRSDQFGALLVYSWLTLQPFVWSFGSDFMNAGRTRFQFDQPEVREAIQFAYDIKWKDHSGPQIGENEGFSSEVQLLTGRIGMVLAGSYMITTMVLGEAHGGMRWGAVVPPAGPRGDRFTRMTWDGISINVKAPPEKKAACWRFIKFLMSERGQAMVARSGRAMPVHRADVEMYMRDATTEGGREAQAACLEAATKYAKMTPATPRYTEIRNILDQDFKAIETGRRSPADLFDGMQRKANEVLKKEMATWSRPTGD